MAIDRVLRHQGPDPKPDHSAQSGVHRDEGYEGLTWPAFVCFYTPEYEDEASRLRYTLDSRGITDYTIKKMKSRGSWVANTNMKAAFVEDQLRAWEKPIVWLDADARVRRLPTLLASLATGHQPDIAYFLIPKVFDRQPAKCPWNLKRYGGGAVAGGTLYFGHSPRAFELIDRWKALSEKRPDRWEQQNLQQVLGEMRDEDLRNDVPERETIDEVGLPQSYCKVFDCKWYSGQQGPVVIEHTQASRRLRRKMARG